MNCKLKTGLILVCLAAYSGLAQLQQLDGHVPAPLKGRKAAALKRLPATERMSLIIGLPLRNREELTNLLEQIYDPGTTNFHQYLTPEQFTERFGPTETDYQSVMRFAKTNGLVVTGTYSNRTLLDVNGSIQDIERVFHVRMGLYPHPKEARTFYAPDTNRPLTWTCRYCTSAGWTTTSSRNRTCGAFQC